MLKVEEMDGDARVLIRVGGTETDVMARMPIDRVMIA